MCLSHCPMLRCHIKWKDSGGNLARGHQIILRWEPFSARVSLHQGIRPCPRKLTNDTSNRCIPCLCLDCDRWSGENWRMKCPWSGTSRSQSLGRRRYRERQPESTRQSRLGDSVRLGSKLSSDDGLLLQDRQSHEQTQIRDLVTTACLWAHYL